MAHEHEPDGSHAHSHRHGHTHGHGHGHAHADAEGPLLEEGDGVGKILFFDCFSGVAGDMTIAALLDLGVPLFVVERAVSALPIEGFHLIRGQAVRSGIVAVSFDVQVDAKQPLRTYGEIDRMLVEASLDDSVKDMARRMFRRLGESESRVHRMPLEEVHFHEVGAVDAIVDIVGSAAALSYLGAEVVVAPLPMGRGFVQAQHGVLPLPAPAVVHCLRGLPTYAVDIDFELVTPTGAAIVAAVATRASRWPTLSPERVGFGAGKRELQDRPNLLRLVLGESTDITSENDATHVLIEANVDDMTGELAGHAMEALFLAGALDAWAAPITMKKGRPGLTLSALAPLSHGDSIASVMLRETSSIGVRRRTVSRIERPRRTAEIETDYGKIRVKISEGPFGPPQLKPEFDDCASAAKKHGVPLRVVMAEALRKAAV